MKNISLFENFIKEVGSLSLAKIIEQIRGNKYKKSVSEIRKLVEIGDMERAKQVKKTLVAFTVSGLFEGGPKMDFLKTYNPFVILDINNLDPHFLRYLIFRIKHIEFTKAVFVSPGGRGLKIIVEVDSKMRKHDLAWHQVRDFYEDQLDVAIEKKGDNITRLCFMSHDPDAYLNPKSSVYKVATSRLKKGKSLSKKILDVTSGKSLKPVAKGEDLKIDYLQTFSTCVLIANAKLVYEKGNRNNYIYQLGRFCNCAKIPLDVAIGESNKAFDLSEDEIAGTIRSAYDWKPFDSVKEAKEIPVKFPPAIPSQVYDKLPVLLKESCSPFRNSHQERDVFLTSALGFLSGVLPGVSGVYGGRLCCPNLFVFVVAPPASGKGTFALTSHLGSAYKNELSKANEKRKVDYREALMNYEKDFLKYEKGDLVEEPEAPTKPDSKYLSIPANIDPDSLTEYLNRNDGSGMFFESEADSLGYVLNQYQDEYSDLLGKAFHHESIVSSSESDGVFVKVSHPKLSVCLSGTPYQMKRFIPSLEGGLLSTFMFYAFESEAVWREVSSKGTRSNLPAFYKDLSKDVLEMIQFLESNPTTFTLTEAQWELMNSTFQKLMEETNQDFGKKALSIVKRMGLNCFRMAMILSAIRKFEEKHLGTELVCSDDDFQVAILLAENYLKHGLFVYESLPEPSETRTLFSEMEV